MSINDVPTTGNLLPTTAPQDSPDSGGNGAPSAAVSPQTPAVSTRRRAASQTNGRKSHGPVTPEGKLRSSQNARKPLERLLGLAEARTLRHEPGAALKLYRELIAPYQPAPALLARHFQDLARLYLELEACESIRDALLDHRAQQNTIKVRSRYREMDAELDVAPKEVFERGLYDLPDSPAKLKKQLDGLAILKQMLEQRQFDSLGPALRQLYGNELDPKSERAKLICIDCQRLMDPSAEPMSDQEIHELVFLIEQEEQYAEDGCELELDKRTVTGSASISYLAPRRKEQWLYLQTQRLRQAIDRKQWVITGLLQTPMMARRYGAEAMEEVEEHREHAGRDQPPSGAGDQPASGPAGQPSAGAGGRPGGRAKHAAGAQTPRGYGRNAKTNPRSALESTKASKNEPKTNLNEPGTNPSPRTPAQPKSCGISKGCEGARRASTRPTRTCSLSPGCRKGQDG